MIAFVWIGAAVIATAALLISLWDESRIVVVDVARSHETEVDVWDA